MRSLAEITLDAIGALTQRDFALVSKIGVSAVGNLLAGRPVKPETIEKLIAHSCSPTGSSGTDRTY